MGATDQAPAGQGAARPVRCCGQPGSAPLDRASAQDLAGLLKAVADPVRLQIVSILRCSPELSACACDLQPVLGVSQPTVSHHLKVLAEAGLVTREQRGQWAWFSLVPDRLTDLADALAGSR